MCCHHILMVRCDRYKARFELMARSKDLDPHLELLTQKVLLYLLLLLFLFFLFLLLLLLLLLLLHLLPFILPFLLPFLVTLHLS